MLNLRIKDGRRAKAIREALDRVKVESGVRTDPRALEILAERYIAEVEGKDGSGKSIVERVDALERRLADWNKRKSSIGQPVHLGPDWI